ncbi:acyl carrier protein [Kribbella sp. NPDC051587]|uniref:acyl carrier protein n=1 Tax=Kribbella sp. NPDC051587 TaxID=3364119 RepID=UPI0037A5B28A
MADDTLRTWLTSRVAVYLDRDPACIESSRPLAEYGLDSLTAVALCADLEDEYDLEVDPVLAWDHPSIEALAAVIATMIAEKSQA